MSDEEERPFGPLTFDQYQSQLREEFSDAINSVRDKLTEALTIGFVEPTKLGYALAGAFEFLMANYMEHANQDQMSRELKAEIAGLAYNVNKGKESLEALIRKDELTRHVMEDDHPVAEMLRKAMGLVGDDDDDDDDDDGSIEVFFGRL